jgi:hypothetical protein
MRILLLITLSCLAVGCISSARTREAHCLGVMMMDVWGSEHDLETALSDWRIAQQSRVERSAGSLDTSHRPMFVGYQNPFAVSGLETHRMDQSRELEQERLLYEQVRTAHERKRITAEWYRLVARRVQTRMEEDEMLYPVLGTLATSAAVVLYPVIRWNIRSVLWDGEDPDAEDDPVQKFCTSRLANQDVVSPPQP